MGTRRVPCKLQGGGGILNTLLNYKWAQYAKVLHYAKLERLSRYKQYNLLGPFLSYIEFEVLWVRHQFPVLLIYYDCNLRR